MREKLLPVVAQENDMWVDFSDAIDEVFSYNVDNPVKVLSSLRDTYQWKPLILDNPIIDYNDEEPQLVSGFTYRVIYADFSDADLVKKIVLEKKVVPTQSNPNSRPIFTDIPLGTTGQTYSIEGSNRFSVNFSLASDETLHVISYRNSTYSIEDYYDYGVTQEEATFPLSGVNLNIETTIPIGGNEPVGFRTGYPYNLVILYGRDSSQSNGFQYITPANYFLESDGSTITFLSIPSNFDEIRVTIRKPAVEISRKLNYLGFNFEDVEYVTRPTFIDNTHVLQTMSDSIGQYYIQTSGTPQFLDFYQYCSNSTFDIFQLWAQDNGDLTQYENLTRTELLPANWEYVPVVGDGNGGWYPTSHVDVFYDIFLYGSQINLDGFREFFNYVSPINLVLNKVIFGGDPGVSQSSTMNIKYGAYTKIIYY